MLSIEHIRFQKRPSTLAQFPDAIRLFPLSDRVLQPSRRSRLSRARRPFRLFPLPSPFRPGATHFHQLCYKVPVRRYSLCYPVDALLKQGAHDGLASCFACSCRGCVRYTGQVDDRAHLSHLAATRGTQHSPDRLIRHTVITGDVTERFSLLDPLEHGCPCRGRDLPARIRSGLRVARQRHQQWMVKGGGERISLG